MTTTHPIGAQAATGPCGCGGNHEGLCSLHCLVEPRFFCGQLLTDQDLTALLDWAKAKTRLSRFRHGWGVVCGLDVRCDPASHDGVIVSKGYAVDCCGDDIIVCEDTSFALTEVCRAAKDPCADLRPRDNPADRRPAEPEPFVAGVEGFRVAAGDLRVVDLYIRYREEPSEPQTALGRSVCKQAGSCEFGRTREVFSLEWRYGSPAGHPSDAAAEDWDKAYQACLEALRAFRQFAPHELPPADDVRRWMTRWIDAHPPRHFCYLKDWICDPATDLSRPPDAVKALFWLVLDCRVSFLRCDCLECDSSSSVPLARIWMEAKQQKGKTQCRVLAIDTAAPYRRRIAPSCWPARRGTVNLGGLIWQSVDEAAALLAGTGIGRGNDVPFALPDNFENLERELARGVSAPVGGTVAFQVLDAGRFGRRVVGLA